MKIARLRIKVLTQNQKCFENYVIVVYICKKKYLKTCLISVLFYLYWTYLKMPGLELGAPDAIFMFTNIVCIEEIFT